MIYVGLKNGLIVASPDGIYARVESGGALSILDLDECPVSAYAPGEWTATFDKNTDITKLHGFVQKEEVPSHA